MHFGKPVGTHTDLPVEVEVCKELGIHGKSEIEAFGIEPFIQKMPTKRLALHARVGEA